MRIGTLLAREPFGKILERTLADFLSISFGRQYNVTWHQGTRRKCCEGQLWFCNPYLNIIFRPGINRDPLLPAVYEFSRSAKPWRTPINKLYVMLATSRYTARLMATATIEIAPSVPYADDMVIIGGNHHIRLLDYQKQCCTVINKHGYCVKLMENEVDVRSNHPYLPAPRLLAKSEDGSWYSEELILGTPINRLKDQRQADDAVQQILPQLFRMYEATQKAESIQSYVGRIFSRITKSVAGNKLLSDVQRDNLGSFVERFSRMASERTGDLMTVQAHGDFQPANILVGIGGPWLIDWEYTTQRQVGYDALVYALLSRSASGLSQRLGMAFTGTNALLESWPGLEWQDHKKRKATLALFLLEELDLKLMENDNSCFTSLDTGLVNFYQEIVHFRTLFERCSA